jgi:hypothetical protein
VGCFREVKLVARLREQNDFPSSLIEDVSKITFELLSADCKIKLVLIDRNDSVVGDKGNPVTTF